MRLYDLVEFRNKLSESIDQLQDSTDLDNKIALVDSIKDLHGQLGHAELLNSIIHQYQQQIQQTQSIVDNIKHILSTVDSDIDLTAKELFDTDEYRNYWTEQGLSQDVIYPDDVEAVIGAKIASYSNWYYPCMQINPRSVTWINYMVAGDPLYLTGHRLHEVKDMISKYPAEYQRRVRLYETLDRDFGQLPREQMGFVLCWENFNYLSSEKIDIYLEKVVRLLRPGGVFMFSYNNCDLKQSARTAEERGYSYNSSRLLQAKVINMGYEIIDFVDLKTELPFNNYISWAEIKLPGELSTLKKSRSLAQIHEK